MTEASKGVGENTTPLSILRAWIRSGGPRGMARRYFYWIFLIDLSPRYGSQTLLSLQKFELKVSTIFDFSQKTSSKVTVKAQTHATMELRPRAGI
jgi:hypothetical protein